MSLSEIRRMAMELGEKGGGLGLLKHLESVIDQLNIGKRDPTTGLLIPFVHPNGTKEWYDDNGEIHRDEKDENGMTLPAIEYTDRGTEWMEHGRKHRIDKDSKGLTLPAVDLSNGVREWWVDGVRDRKDRNENGSLYPAIEDPLNVLFFGKKVYWIDGVKQ